MIREPLFHFLVLALLIFAYFAVFPDSDNDRAGVYDIVIGPQQVQRLKEEWAQSWRRPPNEQQLNNLIESAIKEEVYYREAVALGLDKNDSVVRNRMVQKMRFLQSEALAEPTLADLQDQFEQNPAKYQPESRYSFQQVYLGQGGDVQSASIGDLIKRLDSGTEEPSDVGLTLSVPSSFASALHSEIVRQFGLEFANTISEKVPPNSTWYGPIVSGFGQHLVRLDHVQADSSASLDDAAIRQRVENDWRATQGKALENRIYSRLRENYTVHVQKGK